MQTPTTPIPPVHYFSKGDMATLVTDKQFKALLENLFNASEQCIDRADDLEESYGSDVANPTVESLRDMAHAMGDMIDRLEACQQVVEGKIYLWTPPRNDKFEIEWDKEITLPNMERFDMVRHVMLSPSERRLFPHELNVTTKEKDWPTTPLLYTEPNLANLPESGTTQYYIDECNSDLSILDKGRFQTLVDFLRDSYKKNQSALIGENAELEEVLSFLQKPAIQACYQPPSNRGINYN